MTVSNLRKSLLMTVEGKPKTADLTVILDGLKVKMSNFPKRAAASATSNGEI